MTEKINIKWLKNVIKSLSSSQGFYGRLYINLDENKKWNELLKVVKKNKITNPVDLILLIEG